MIRSACCLLFCSLFACGSTFVTAGEVTISQQEGQLQVKIGDADFATYNYSTDYRKPFFLPVQSADGTILTRSLNDPEDNDHPHHKGVWVAVDEVNGVKYWVEQGRIVTRDLKVVTPKGNPAVFEVTNDWLDKGTDEPVIAEHTRISIHANGLMSYAIRFAAEHGDVEFGDTKEGLLGYRMPTWMKEKNTGKVVSSDGSEGTVNCWGRPFAWIDYSGVIDGNTFGVTLMDHPDNLRPSRYHVRNYGLFSISPFGERAYTKGRENAEPKHVHLKQGEDLSLQYAIYFHTGNDEDGQVADVYEQFVKSTQAQKQ